MSRRLSLHAFTELGWSDGSHGLWRYPRFVPERETADLQWWTDLVKVAERGCMDTFFFADAMGMGGFTENDRVAEIRDGRTILFDPAVAIPAFAAATENIGFLFTSSILQEHPFTFARKVSTLDQLTNGRVAWNIVTSYSPNAARNFGMDDLPPREERYEWAQEYVDVTYKLWEGSWDDDALVVDRETGVYVDPNKVHTVDHEGERYKVKGPHLIYATPQRTPLLVQAGGSGPGRAFAARNAEMQFVAAGSVDVKRKLISEVRELASGAGRDPSQMAFTASTSFVVGSTDEEARRKADELDAHRDFTDLIAALSSSIGRDLTVFDPDEPVPGFTEATSNGGMSGVIDAIAGTLPPGKDPTVREIVRASEDRTRVVGSPEHIADVLEEWQSAGVDGVACGFDPRPQALVDFVDEVVPVLQDRGLAQREYGSGTLRNKIMGYGDRLPDSHPAARYRD